MPTELPHTHIWSSSLSLSLPLSSFSRFILMNLLIVPLEFSGCRRPEYNALLALCIQARCSVRRCARIRIREIIRDYAEVRGARDACQHRRNNWFLTITLVRRWNAECRAWQSNMATVLPNHLWRVQRVIPFVHFMIVQPGVGRLKRKARDLLVITTIAGSEYRGICEAINLTDFLISLIKLDGEPNRKREAAWFVLVRSKIESGACTHTHTNDSSSALWCIRQPGGLTEEIRSKKRRHPKSSPLIVSLTSHPCLN